MSQHVVSARRGFGWMVHANTAYHELGLKLFGTVVFVHWLEHVFQAVQIWALGWPRPDAGGALGLAQPWLVTSELLHYAFALVMLAGFVIFLPGFAGRSRTWWVVALGVQVWHHLEHAILLLQAQSGLMFLGRPVPTSLLQLWLPRVELHLLYNGLVTVPMLVAMYLHLYPRGDGGETVACSCARGASRS